MLLGRDGYHVGVQEQTTHASPEILDPANPGADPRPVPPKRQRYLLFGEMLVFAIVSLIASWVLSYDAILLAADPNAELACSINAVLDCARVGASWQANVFGFPNAFLGMIAEPVVMTIAVASLSGVRFPRWFMFTANVVYFLGVIFAYWLLYQSTYDIGALCPWCLTVTVSTTFVFWSMTAWNIQERNHYFSDKVAEKLERFHRGGWLTIAFMAWIAIVLVIEILHWVPRYL